MIVVDTLQCNDIRSGRRDNPCHRLDLRILFGQDIAQQQSRAAARKFSIERGNPDRGFRQYGPCPYNAEHKTRDQAFCSPSASALA